MAEREPNCAIVDKAIKIADVRGLDSSKIFCPLIHCCDGSSCMFVMGNDAELKNFKMVNQIDKFYAKVDKTMQIYTNGQRNTRTI